MQIGSLVYLLAAAAAADAVTSTVAPAAAVSLEIMYLQDVSSSLAKKALIPEAIGAFEKLNATYHYSRFGLGTFIDRPIEPFGGDATYCYKIQYPLTHDSAPFVKAIKNMRFHAGGDPAECQLTALAEASQAALNRWTVISDEYESGEKIVRIALLVTDAPYHQDGDFVEEGYDLEGNLVSLPRPNYEPTDELPQLISVNALEEVSHHLDDMDYPSVDRVAELYSEARITPLFVVTKNVLSVYQNLVKQLGRGHVTLVNEDMTNLGLVIVQSVEHLLKEQESFHCSADGDCPCDSPGECDDSENADVMIRLDNVPQVIRYSKEEVVDFINDEELSNLQVDLLTPAAVAEATEIEDLSALAV